jgi:1-acyl-sn-glycerol-3-phosphate acyltransferase
MAVRAHSLLSRMTRGFLLWLFRRKGWAIEGSKPQVRRAVILGVPHTSNWDFVFFLGTTHHFGIEPNFMGKVSLFRWPLRRFMFDMGGVPVDRSARGNYVDAMIAEFARREDFMLVIAPEGTRGGATKWRSGFYHIAVGAGIPVVCGWADHAAMRGGLGPPIDLTGDYPADMARIADFYRSVIPGHPRLAAITAGEMPSG